MFILIARMKKLLTLSVTVLSISLISITPARAQGSSISEQALIAIMGYTYAGAQSLNTIPTYLQIVATMALEWILPDDTAATATAQADLATYTNQLYINGIIQNALQYSLSSAFLGSSGQALQNVNDLTFLSVLGTPLVTPDPRAPKGIAALTTPPVNPAYNYLLNASSLNITHVAPSSQMGGSQSDIQRYTTFYNTISAVQTFNAYVLTQLYVDNQSASAITPLQSKLINDASSSTWFTQISSENIGVVLRQILIFNSQTYLLLVQLLQTEKQMLATQAMTNTLLVIGNEFTEGQLLGRANGTTSSGTL